MSLLANPRFVPYDATIERPNLVVDGAANAATVLTLSHWPGTAQPPGYEHDLSAGMAFRYLDRPPAHAPADAVTNNHFDQDGLAGVLALSDPEAALTHRELLLDLASAGDFGTYRHRAAARASMAVFTYHHPEQSPLADQLAGLDDAGRTALLYREVLPLAVSLVTEPERFRPLWAEEDDRLTASEAALRTGRVTIEERPDVDLAVITVPPRPPGGGHRFGFLTMDDVHPLAVNTASSCVRQLFVAPGRYRYVDRYETWIQYRSRPVLPRVDLRPLAERLTARETGTVRWRADPPSALSPQLRSDDGSSLDPTTVEADVTDHLRSAPVAWRPHRSDPGGA